MTTQMKQAALFDHSLSAELLQYFSLPSLSALLNWNKLHFLFHAAVGFLSFWSQSAVISWSVLFWCTGLYMDLLLLYRALNGVWLLATRHGLEEEESCIVGDRGVSARNRRADERTNRQVYGVCDGRSGRRGSRLLHLKERWSGLNCLSRVMRKQRKENTHSCTSEDYKMLDPWDLTRIFHPFQHLSLFY